jgi:hypothetical protein
MRDWANLRTDPEMGAGGGGIAEGLGRDVLLPVSFRQTRSPWGTYLDPVLRAVHTSTYARPRHLPFSW